MVGPDRFGGITPQNTCVVKPIGVAYADCNHLGLVGGLVGHMRRGCLRAAVIAAERLVEDGYHPLDVGAGDLRVGGGANRPCSFNSVRGWWLQGMVEI